MAIQDTAFFASHPPESSFVKFFLASESFDKMKTELHLYNIDVNFASQCVSYAPWQRILDDLVAMNKDT